MGTRNGSTKKCPICKEGVAPRTDNKAWPFCSNRCRMIDLSKWINEEYRVPASISERRLNPDVDEHE